MTSAVVEPETKRHPRNDLRWLADAYVATQRVRIAVGNRKSAVDRGVDMGPVPASIERLFVTLEGAEDDLVDEMADALKDHAAMVWLSRIKGVGPTLGAKVLGLIGEIAPFTTVSKLWRFSGYAVIDGKAERPKKGEKLHYCRPLKTTCYLIASSFLKCDSPYRLVYDRAKERYQETKVTGNKETDWTPGHIHLASMRVMMKVFLSHLWETWRKAEGLETRELYVIEQLGHEMKYRPDEFLKPEK